MHAQAVDVDEAVLDAVDVGEVRHPAASIGGSVEPVRLACLALIACVLAVPAVWAAPAVAATPAVPSAVVARTAAPSAVARTLSARTRAVAARLRVTADFAPRRTTVAFRGTLRVRKRGVALVLLRCADARCVRYARRGRALRRLPRGRRRLSLRLRVGPSPFARVEVRVRRRVVAHTTLRRPTPRPPVIAPPPAAAPGAAPFSTTPPLQPAYDPAIPDYTVACEPARTVRVVDDGGERTLGLAAGGSFAFSVGGRRHTARCLPRTWTGWTVKRDGTPQSEWIVFNTPAGYTVIADGHGVPVRRRAGVPPLQDGRVLPDGSVAVGRVSEGSWGRAPYERVAVDGTPLGSLDTVGSSADPHELQILPNGNALDDALRAARRRRPHEPRRPAGRHRARRRDPGGHARPPARVVVEQRRPHRDRRDGIPPLRDPHADRRPPGVRPRPPQLAAGRR